MVRRDLSFPIHVYSVTVRVDKRLHIPVILLNNHPNNPRQTFVHPRGLFLFESFVEHFYQSLTRNGSLSAMERPLQILDTVAGAKASRQPLCVSIVTAHAAG
jgi:hypothetical protein